MTTDRQIVVFAGPSLGLGEWPEALDAELRAPAAQGDIAAAVLQYKNCVIGLIDGIFQGAPAVRHKEILWALDQGATVFGAASMGALRAAELSRFGMHGRGLVYRWYRLFALAPDDAVAVLHAPAAIGASALTDALIDLRMRFKQARRCGLIDRATEHLLIKTATELHYTERRLSAVLRIASQTTPNLPQEQLLDRAISRKQMDASALLRELVLRQRTGNWPQASEVPKFIPTDAFLQDMSEGGFSMDTFLST